MNKQTLDNSKEQQAKILWVGFNLDKENDFWAEYDILLNSSRNNPKAIVSAQPLSKQTKVSGKILQSFHPIFFAYIWRIVYLFGGPAMFVKILLEEDLSGGGGAMLFIMGFILCIAIPLYFWFNFYVFSVSDSGLHVSRALFVGEKHFAWSDIKTTEIDENCDDEGNCSRNLIVTTRWHGRYSYKNNLSEADRQQLKHALVKHRFIA